MNEFKLVEDALGQFKKATGMEGTWQDRPEGDTGCGIDGELNIKVKQQRLTLPVQIKRELRNYHLNPLEKLARQYPKLMVLAGNIFPALREQLRAQKIAYLEANGNCYLEQEGLFILVDGNQPYQVAKQTSNRAFTPAGLKVVFHFLWHDEWINHPYREVADRTKISLGQINNVMEGLKASGFLLPKGDNTWVLADKKRLLHKWIGLYAQKLQLKLIVGTYRFVDRDAFTHWRDLPLEAGKTFWGGEPAADLLTNHLRPGQLTLYTSEERIELTKKYRLVPDENGPVIVYQKFWCQKDQSATTAPPLLVYADLINQGDKRSLETADIIYEQYLQSQF